MPNFIFGYSFVDYTATMTNADSNYPVSNLKLYSHLKRHCRSTATTETSITLDFGSTKNILGVMLNDVNFVSAYIEGSADGNTFPFSQLKSVAKDDEVNRYKGYFILTNFSYRYLRIRIPAQTPVDGLSCFKISSIVVIDTRLELQKNPSYDYEHWATEPEPKINEFTSGGVEVVSMGDDLVWRGSFFFNALIGSEKSDIYVLASQLRDQLLVFFENEGDTSKAYICRRMNEIKKKRTHDNRYKIDTISLLEAV